MADSFRAYDGSEFTVLERPSAASDPVVMRFRLADRCGAPPPHVHPKASESYEVESGSLEVQLDGEWRTLSAGESVSVEPGRSHTFRNHSGAEAVARNVHRPHHEFEAYLRRVVALANELEAATPKSPKAALAMARIWQDHSDLIRPAPLPLKVAFPVLAASARLLRVKTPAPA